MELTDQWSGGTHMGHLGKGCGVGVGRSSIGVSPKLPWATKQPLRGWDVIREGQCLRINLIMIHDNYTFIQSLFPPPKQMG